MEFSFITCPKIVFGAGTFERLSHNAAGTGRRFLFVSNIPGFFSSELFNKAKAGLEEEGAEVYTVEAAQGEPEVSGVDAVADLARNLGCDALVGVGGGSALDTAKAAAAVATNGGSVRDYLERVGNKKLSVLPLKFIAVPTTSGTGSEVTKNAVVKSKRDNVKASIRSDMLMADLVVNDPLLAALAPARVTAYSGMDAICQLIESYTTKNHNPFCDALCLYNLPRAMEAVIRAYENPGDIEARSAMALASMCSGMTLANAGLGFAHGVAAGLGAVCGVPHGLACAVMLPVALEYNNAKGVERVQELGRIICGESENAARALIERVTGLNKAMGIPEKLGDIGVKQTDIEALIPASMGSSMKKNPVEVQNHELRSIFEKML